MLECFKSVNSNIEFTKIKDGVITVIKEKEALENKEANIYFLGGVSKDLKYTNGIRAKDSDIVEKNYFCLDLDIAKNFEQKYNEKISYEDIEKEGYNLIENLKYEDQYFSEFSFIIISGGGLHIYYTGEFKTFNKEIYKMGVKEIYKKWNNLMGSDIFSVDFACCNIGRILRLPGSINQKNGKECKILFSEKKESKLFNAIVYYGEQKTIKNEQERLKAEKELLKNHKSENNFYEEINKIPAYVIAEKILPQFKNKGKNFDNGKGGYTGFYYIKETNTICNGGSRHFNWGDVSSCYNNFSIIKNQFGFSNKETFEYFRNLLKK